MRTHSTPAYKLVIALEEPLAFRWGGHEGRARVLLVPPGIAHALRTRGAAVGLFLAAGGPRTPFLTDATSVVLPERALQTRLSGLAREALDESAPDDARLIDEAFGCVLPQRNTRLDARVEGSLHRLGADPNVPLAALARAAGISPERLRHLVVAETGRTLRSWRLFQRTLLAIEQQLRGARPAQAAAFAGFADQAHFTRSFVRTFGRTPSQVPSAARLWSTWAERAAPMQRSSFSLWRSERARR